MMQNNIIACQTRKGVSSLTILILLLVLSLPCFSAGPDSLRISTFDIDATPPVGSMLTYDTMTGTWDLGLRARGVVIQNAGKPIVLCAIDWIGIGNESQDVFKETLAKSANTLPERVAIHTVHQHDAPICDFSAEKILKKEGIAPGCFDGSFARLFLGKLGNAVHESLGKSVVITHVSRGEAAVRGVASNRRVATNEGKIEKMRASSCKDPILRALPVGLIDSMVTVISFWSKNKPVAVLSFYATHPQSYYRTGIANPDFPGIARFYRQLEVPGALHIHFNGAGANVAAGKYNDGTPEMRGILAQRLADGMKRAWESSEKQPVTSLDLKWETKSVLLPANSNVVMSEAEMKKMNHVSLANNMSKFVWLKRNQENKTIDIGCLVAGNTRSLFLPGELFVEYQLAAKAMRPDLFVALAAYGDYGPFYIGTKNEYKLGGYEIESSAVAPEAEDLIMNAMRELLGR